MFQIDQERCSVDCAHEFGMIHEHQIVSEQVSYEDVAQQMILDTDQKKYREIIAHEFRLALDIYQKPSLSIPNADQCIHNENQGKTIFLFSISQDYPQKRSRRSNIPRSKGIHPTQGHSPVQSHHGSQENDSILHSRPEFHPKPSAYPR